MSESGAKKRDWLEARFNLVSDKIEDGNSTIDQELIELIVAKPDIELILNIDPGTTAEPEKVYTKIVTALATNEFKAGEIVKIITAYVNGRVWNGWAEEERERFVSGVVGKINQKSEKEKEYALANVCNHISGRDSDIDEPELYVILDSIDRVERVIGLLDQDEGKWRISVNGQVAEIPTSKIKTYHAFETFYLNRFGKRLPSVLKKRGRNGEDAPWDKFLDYVSDIAEIVEDDKNTLIFETEALLDKVLNLPIAKNEDEWAKRSNLLLYSEEDKCYMLKNPDMMRFMRELMLTSAYGKFLEYTYKKNMIIKGATGNPMKRAGGKVWRAWHFKEWIVRFYRGEDGGK